MKTTDQNVKIRDVVISFMHYDGRNRFKLDVNRWEALYLMADGFGVIDRPFAREQDFDWSHVRDSSCID